LPDFSEGIVPETDIPIIEASENEFVLTKLPDPVPAPENSAKITASPEVALPFALQKDLFSSLLADYGIAKELEDIVGKRVADEIEAKWTVERQRIGQIEQEAAENARKQGHAEGYAAGQSKAQEEFEALRKKYWEDFSTRLNGICEEILKEKEKILHDHERQWCQGTLNILKRFQIGRALELGRDIDRWLSEAVADFGTRRKIKIFVSEEEFARFSTGPVGENPRWELLPDPSLKTGESRYESEGGGVFFAPTEEFKKLEALLTQYDV
jgi:flagellar biosynthesis/type III secretory pathway protein FliH